MLRLGDPVTMNPLAGWHIVNALADTLESLTDVCAKLTDSFAGLSLPDFSQKTWRAETTRCHEHWDNEWFNETPPHLSLLIEPGGRTRHSMAFQGELTVTNR